MNNKQYNALFSFIWNIANDLPNSRKKGYLILGLTTMAVLLSEKILAVMLAVMLAVIMSPVCPQLCPQLSQVCRKLEGQGCKLRAKRCNLHPTGCNLERKVAA